MTLTKLSQWAVGLEAEQGKTVKRSYSTLNESNANNSKRTPCSHCNKLHTGICWHKNPEQAPSYWNKNKRPRRKLRKNQKMNLSDDDFECFIGCV